MADGRGKMELSSQDFDKLVDAYYVDVRKWCLLENVIVMVFCHYIAGLSSIRRMSCISTSEDTLDTNSNISIWNGVRGFACKVAASIMNLLLSTFR